MNLKIELILLLSRYSTGSCKDISYPALSNAEVMVPPSSMLSDTENDLANSSIDYLSISDERLISIIVIRELSKNSRMQQSHGQHLRSELTVNPRPYLFTYITMLTAGYMPEPSSFLERLLDPLQLIVI